MATGVGHMWSKIRAWSSLNVSLRFFIPIMLLRSLNVMPGIIAFVDNTLNAWLAESWNTNRVAGLHKTWIDFWLANGWCAVAGYWAWIATTGLLRRWLHHYEVGNAMVRLTTWTVIMWGVSAFIDIRLGPDYPIEIWVIKAFSLLLVNIIRLTVALQKGQNKMILRWTVVRSILMPLFIMSCLTMWRTLIRLDDLWYTTSQAMEQRQFLLDTFTPKSNHATALVFILSSWSEVGAQRRDTLRKTSLQLLSNDDTVYRFIIGQPPSAASQHLLGPALYAESQTYQDMLIVPASDNHRDESQKTFQAMRWADQLSYDYLIKTDDDLFVRWDELVSELRMHLPSNEWRGHVKSNLMHRFHMDDSLPVLPLYTSGSLYTISRDIVRWITTTRPRRFIPGDDGQSLAVWLMALRLQPIHDHRYHIGWTCRDDAVSRRVPHDYLEDMEHMLQNIKQQKNMCDCVILGDPSFYSPFHGKDDISLGNFDWLPL